MATLFGSIAFGVMLGRGWYLNVSRGSDWCSPWAMRSGLVLVALTILAVSLWGLPFAGLLGMPPT